MQQLPHLSLSSLPQIQFWGFKVFDLKPVIKAVDKEASSSLHSQIPWFMMEFKYDKSKCLLLPLFSLSFGYHLFGTYSIHVSVSIFLMLIIDHQKNESTVVVTPGIWYFQHRPLPLSPQNTPNTLNSFFRDPITGCGDGSVATASTGTELQIPRINVKLGLAVVPVLGE